MVKQSYNITQPRISDYVSTIAKRILAYEYLNGFLTKFRAAVHVRRLALHYSRRTVYINTTFSIPSHNPAQRPSKDTP